MVFKNIMYLSISFFLIIGSFYIYNGASLIKKTTSYYDDTSVLFDEFLFMWTSVYLEDQDLITKAKMNEILDISISELETYDPRYRIIFEAIKNKEALKNE